MDDLQPVALASLAIIVSICVVRWYTNPLRAIPTVEGSSLPGLSYIAALRNMYDVRAVLEEGYRRYPESAFKLSIFDRWIVVVSGKNTVEDIRKRPEEELSFHSGYLETLQQGYTCEHPAATDDRQTNVVKERLTQMLPTVLPNTVDEVVHAVNHIKAREDVWTSVEVMPVIQKIVARVSNRAFVGLPLCRNEEYLKIAIDFAVHVMKAAYVLRGLRVPEFMKAFVAPFISNVKHVTNLAVTHVRPIIEDRSKALAESSDDKRNDLLQFLPMGETVFVTTQRLLMLNFAAIHTSSVTITQVLYHLAEDPELVRPLREEIRTAVSSDGWTNVALGKMRKLDSIMRETLRYHGVGLLLMWRKTMKDVTLLDGTRIPKGTVMAVNAHALHHDDTILENAGTFDPFRYKRMRGAEGQGIGTHFTSTSPECIYFGYGRHACPGRYFASAQVKVILGHTILNYDLKLGGDGLRPPDVYWGFNVIPAPHGRILFKKRERLE